jgi:hypothetical protein
VTNKVRVIVQGNEDTSAVVYSLIQAMAARTAVLYLCSVRFNAHVFSLTMDSLDAAMSRCSGRC